MILDKLLEKKDLLAYIAYRTKCLYVNRKKLAEVGDPKKRHEAYKQTTGRIKELRELRKVISHGKVKTLSKKYCEIYGGGK